MWETFLLKFILLPWPQGDVFISANGKKYQNIKSIIIYKIVVEGQLEIAQQKTKNFVIGLIKHVFQ